MLESPPTDQGRTDIKMTAQDTAKDIYDREAFLDVLATQVTAAHTTGTKLALLVVDIDRFYRINRNLGYDAGDQVLKQLGALLRDAVREQDKVGRISVDRFAIVLPTIMNVGHAELAAYKILRLLDAPFFIGTKQIVVDCTIALSICPLHASDHYSLLSECESTLVDARQKRQRLGVSQVPEEDALLADWDIELALNGVLERDQLQLYYQPKVSLTSGRVIGAEALLRWRHPDKGFVSPAYFIPVAERMGYMKQITNWIINTAMRNSAEWSDRWGDLHVSVNMPPELLLAPDLRDQVKSAIALWGGKHIQLTLEMIERSLVAEPARIFPVLEDLQAQGVQVSIDDFGTGYSSLSYFERLPANELKIDQSFVRDIKDKQGSQSIVKLVVDLAHAFDMQVVAEGVEDLETLRYLKTIGCDTVQGYYVARPMPQADICEWIAGFPGLDA